MRFKSVTAASSRADAFVLFRPEKKSALAKLPVPDPLLSREAEAAVAAGEFTGKAGETLLLRGGTGGRRLLLVALGDPEKVTDDGFRSAVAVAARALESRGVGRACFLLPPGRTGPDAARTVAEAAGLGSYVFDRCKSAASARKLAAVEIAPEPGAKGGAALARGVREGAAIHDAVAYARDLGNLPPNTAHAIYLARRAKEMAGGPMRVRSYTRTEIVRMRMGAFAAVAQGSLNEPRLIEFRYRGAGAKGPTLALIGKGVTFDTGGISIKPSQGMEEMKFDMCGGAAVMGLMHLVKALRPKVNLHALVPATDNMPDGAAYRPGDIVTARNGKTIEIHSTDAEGRLLLCDALAYAAESKPAAMIDLATLTGACAVALADAACGLFGSDDKLVQEIAEAGKRCGEQAWPMPLYPRYTEMMKGHHADLKNAGGRYGGACTAAAFLKEFTAGLPWAHLDIAGVAWTDRDDGMVRRGATGYGVRLLWEFVKGRAR